jgi:solute carrier family 44 (choline transporter-like protein), member 2/4/5
VSNGPIEERSCTDVLFCLLFLAFLVGLGVVSMFGFKNGQPERLLAPLDADGKFCGIDSGYESFPYLYLADLSASATDLLSTAVCVSDCPMDDAIPVSCKPTSIEKDCNAQGLIRYNTKLGMRLSVHAL